MQEFFSLQLLISALVLASIYALVSLGLNLIYGTMRLLNVAHGELMMIGGYVSYGAFQYLGVSSLISMFAAFAVTALLGAACYATLFRYLMRQRALAARLEANSLLIFFGLSVILQNLMQLCFTANPQSYPTFTQILHIGGTPVELNRLVVLAIGAVVTGLCVLFFRFSRLGLATRALIQQRDAAALVGIPADRINFMVFCLGFGLAGLAGSLLSMMQDVTPSGGFPFTISAFIIIILGGLGNLAGGLLGATLLAVMETYGVALTSDAYRSILVYGVFITALFFRPQGLLGRRIA